MERERSRIRDRVVPEPDDTDRDGLSMARDEAERLLQAADEAISRALSRDSQAFLRANRQTGGE